MHIRPILKRRNVQGEISLVRELADDPMYHHRYFRMDKETFDLIYTRILAKISHAPNHCRPITPLERLSITLRYLASGNSHISLALNYRVSSASISKIVREVMVAICEEFEKECLPVPGHQDFEKIMQEFETKWDFPMCVGSIDRKHVRIRSPGHSGSQFINYKGFFSVVLMAVVDANYQFILVDIGSSGSNSDGGVLKNSNLGKKLINNSFSFPAPRILPSGKSLPPVIVADDAFPLKCYMLKPYPTKTTTAEESIFNYRLSRARMVVENAFGILSSRWRIYHSPINGSLDLVRLIVKTTVILHNFLMQRKDMDGLTTDRVANGVVVEGNWREDDVHLSRIVRQGSNNATTEAFEVREKFKDYFNSEEGSVHWQRSYVLRGYE